MKLYDVCIRAFVKGNLGDDLFIVTLCGRYPGTSFVMCGEKQYRRIFEKIPNLKYITTDTFFHKWFLRGRNLIPLLRNRLGKNRQGGEIHPLCRWNDFLPKISRRCVLISGSIFMELGQGEFSPTGYYKNEEKYYGRHPYVIGCNFGPYHNEEYRLFYEKRFREAAQVCFRESYSLGLFPDSGLQWAPDILFQTDKGLAQQPEERDYVLVSVVNVEKDEEAGAGALQAAYEQALERLLGRLLAEGEHIVLLGFCNAQGDDKIIRRLLERFPGQEGLAGYYYSDISYGQALGYLAGAKTIVASRYHAMILGWLWGRKVLPVVYSAKMLHVIEDLAPEAEYVLPQQWMEDRDILVKSYRKMLDGTSAPELAEAVTAAGRHFAELDKVLKL